MSPRGSLSLSFPDGFLSSVGRRLGQILMALVFESQTSEEGSNWGSTGGTAATTVAFSLCNREPLQLISSLGETLACLQNLFSASLFYSHLYSSSIVCSVRFYSRHRINCLSLHGAIEASARGPTRAASAQKLSSRTGSFSLWPVCSEQRGGLASCSLVARVCPAAAGPCSTGQYHHEALACGPPPAIKMYIARLEDDSLCIAGSRTIRVRGPERVSRRAQGNSR